MSDALSFAEIDGQHVELLPARTVLSLFPAQVDPTPPDDHDLNVSLLSNLGTLNGLLGNPLSGEGPAG